MELINSPHGLFFVDDNKKAWKANWNGQTSKYDFTKVNDFMAVKNGSDIQVAGDGRVFYIHTDGTIRNILGPAAWQDAILSYQAPLAAAKSDLILADNGRVYYVNTDRKVMYLEWTGNQWTAFFANVYAAKVKAGTEMAVGEGHVFYIADDNKIHFIDGVYSWLQGVRVSNAPNAFHSTSVRTGMDYKQGRLVYVANDRTLGQIGWNGSSWDFIKYSWCMKATPGTRIDISDNGQKQDYLRQ